MFESLESTTIFEVAPTGNDGELFWIHEIENPSGFFAGCDTPSDVLDQIIVLRRMLTKRLRPVDIRWF